MAIRTPAPAARDPSGGGFELAVWYLMRLTGLGLFVLALAHYVITHIVYPSSDPDGRVGGRRCAGAASPGARSTG